MAKYDLEAPVTLSVLDRLIDEEPKSNAEAPLTRAQSLRRLKAALRRDLEWLLNTRRSPDENTCHYEQADKSILAFGLPDITSIGVQSTHDQARLKKAIERTVSRFEPRISDIRVVMEVAPTTVRGIRFHIQGMLQVDPAPEPVAFDTVLELPAGQYEVKGD